MYHHVVAFRFKPEAPPSEIDRFARDLRTFAATVAGVVAYECGSDRQLREGNADFAVAAVFETEAALTTYLDHPRHLAIAARYVPAIVADKHGVQFAATGNATEL